MILAVDIGNTTITLGVVEKTKVLAKQSISTRVSRTVLQKEFQHTYTKLKKYQPFLKAVVICSVVPSATQSLKIILKKAVGFEPWVVGEGFIVPIKNLYRAPKMVGQDRLVGAYAALKLYKAPVLVVDLGTAITFDVVSKRNEYLGGIIVPGIRLTTESLFEKTALLPKVDIHPPKELIGRDTKTSILSGIFYGYGSLCDGLIHKISKKMGCHPAVILTGGYAGIMKKFMTTRVRAIDSDLILKGMSLLYHNLPE